MTSTPTLRSIIRHPQRGAVRLLLPILSTVALLLAATVLVHPQRALAAEHKITMAATQFLPAEMSIPLGDTVTWTNAEVTDYPVVLGSHNIVADDNSFVSPQIAPSKSWSFTFSADNGVKPGTYTYHCGLHPNQMKGVITVTAPGGGGGTSTRTQAAGHDGHDAAVAAKLPLKMTVDPNQGPHKVHVDVTVIEKTINILGVPFQAWTYNGTVPGTIVRLHYGDTLEMTLHNTHNLPHTLHTHFMEYNINSDGSSMTAPYPVTPHQNDNVVGAVGGEVPGLDGDNVPQPAVGQNPVGPYEPRDGNDNAPPGGSHTYTWRMLDVGTIWYHCHVMEATNHIDKGLFGAIIVYPPGWKAEELPPDSLNGNTKAYVTDTKGHRMREDVVITSLKHPAGDSFDSLLAQGGALGGGIHLANFRAWNDPYLIGPIHTGESLLLHVMNIGESPISWHLHGTHWYRLWQIWHPWQGAPAWTKGTIPFPGAPASSIQPFDNVPFTPVAELMHTANLAPGEIMPTLIHGGQPGFWFGHDHVVPNAYLGMVPWLEILPPGVDETTVPSHQIAVEYAKKVMDSMKMGASMPMAPMPGMHPAAAQQSASTVKPDKKNPH